MKCYNLIRTAFFAFLFFSFYWGCTSPSKPVNQAPSPLQQPVEEEPFVIEVKKDPEPVQETASENFEEPAQGDEKDPSDVLEEALESYQDARTAWDKGDSETAVAALDEAFKLILELELPPDSPLIQEKNDLRLLIAQRIQAIYASQLVAVGDNHQTIPIEENQHVLKEIKLFQTVERKSFEESYRRSGRYRDMILKELRKAGLPEELSWMPMIESWFKVNAYSRARALGLWQFISSTGYRFGLKRDRWIDERMDPEKSTRAAIKYLNELHSFFGDWTTALAAYNCGEFRVQRVIRAQRINYLDNFWDLYIMLPRETARFVPRFVATLLIINDPDKYGMTLPQPDPPQTYETILINRPIKLSSLSPKLGLGANALDDLNPELRHKSTPETEYILKVPVGTAGLAEQAVGELARWIPPEATYVNHYVRRGETVSGIASRYRTSISAIARLNRLSRNYLIRPGQRLKVPTRGGSGSSSTVPLKLTKDGEKLIYNVKRGDSLYKIARAFNTSVQRIKSLNSLRSDKLAIGQTLVIQSGKPEGAELYTVRSGDTPYEISKRNGMSLSHFLALNGLSTRSKIYPGQKLWVIPKK